MKKLWICCVLAQLLFAQAVEEKQFSIAAGIGMQYAIFGINAEYELLKNFAASAAIGAVPFAETSAYELGAQYYLTDNTGNWRFRLGLLYGTNAGVVEEYFFFINKIRLLSGLTAGLTIQWMWGERRKWGMEFNYHSILFVSNLPDGAQLDNRLLLPSIGFRYVFGR